MAGKWLELLKEVAPRKADQPPPVYSSFKLNL
jgi:hypothetical protein